MGKYTLHRWAEWEQEFLRRHYADALTVDLAAVLGVPAKRILAKANAMGLKKSISLIAETAREQLELLGHNEKVNRPA